jgi:serine/threonine-protein kinase
LKYDLDNYEKIDDMYIKKQKRKKALFISAIVFSAVFCAAGIILNFMAAQKATDNYEALLEDASKASSYDEKIAYYLEAIGIEDKAGEPEAYKKLIECYKNNNNENKFTSEEYSELVKCIKNNKESLMKNKQNYAEVCFETGKLIWYYYSYDDTGSNSDNQMMRMVAAVDWFSDAFDNSSEDYANRGMAEVYKEIGAFYRDISINTVEGSDKDTYKPFFDNLNDLLERMDGETDIVKIELYEICRSALQQYTTKFLGDGVAYAEQESMYQKVEAGVTELYKSYSLSGSSNITSGTIEEIISKSYGNLSDTLKAIQVAYGIQQNKE